MSYLGNAPARSFISFERQVFTIVNSQTAYALSHSVTNENDIRLVVNNVVQEPGSGKAYTATGTALTLSAALTNGTDEMYCVFLGRATATSAPGAGSIGTAQLASDSVTLAKMASGTDGNIISYDASGNPVAVATGSAGQILTSAGAGAPPTFAAAGANTPMFGATLGSNSSSISQNTTAKVVCNSEEFDTNSAYDTSNGRFTVPSGQAGKYVFVSQVAFDTTSSSQGIEVRHYKNGGGVSSNQLYGDSSSTFSGSILNALQTTTILNLNASDYIETYAVAFNGGNFVFASTNSMTFFRGYKLIS